jgi:hypothetical protein
MFILYIFNSIQFNSVQFISLSKDPLQGVNHMDIEIVREYIYVYKVLQITVKYSVSQWLNIFIQRSTY